MSKTKNGGQESSYNLIAVGTTIQGEITSDGDIRIDGTLIGKAVAKGRVVIGNTGKVDGEVVCQNADVSGSVKGQVEISGLLHLKATAQLLGDITTSKLAIDPGASFSGTCSMGGTPVANAKVSQNGHGRKEDVEQVEAFEEATA